jgi:hypothetical protein
MDARVLRVAALIVIGAACGGNNSEPQEQAPGEARTPTTRALETGAEVMQDVAPVSQIGVYLVGFHPMKDDPSVQMEAHHYCNQVNEDFAQCVLFDGNTETARMNGLEFIISEKLFQSLPQAERAFWHPHNYEILSGQLVGPGLPAPAEHELMRRKMNSYGKTWHVWMTGSELRAGDALPLGPAHLAWSFNRDGEIDSRLLSSRDARMKIDTAERRRQRDDLRGLAHRQEGEDALAAPARK